MVTKQDYLDNINISETAIAEIENVREQFELGEIDEYDTARELAYYISEENRMEWDEAVSLVDVWLTLGKSMWIL